MASRLKIVTEPTATEAAPPPNIPESQGPRGSTTSVGIDFTPAPTRKRTAGWTAEKQRRFIEHLALSGHVGEACGLVGVASSSAYRLKHKPGAESFSRAWDAALRLAGTTRLPSIAFDRALNGRVERFYKDGELVMERRIPSDYLLTWLLARLNPLQFGSPAARAQALANDPCNAARNEMPKLLDSLTDVPPEECECESGEEIDHRLGEIDDGKVARDE